MIENENTPKLRILSGLDPHEYEHPFDGKALDSLQNMKGFDYIVRKYNEHISERIYRILNTGSFIKAEKDTFPDLYKLYLIACKILDLSYVPELYVRWDYSINAEAFGVEKPAITIHSGCIDLLNQEELLFILGHELGHIKSGHVLYRQIAEFLPYFANILGNATLGIGNILTSGLDVGFYYWYRMSEFSADRCGMLTCQNKQVSMNTLSKMAGIPRKYFSKFNNEIFLRQAQEFEGFDESSMNWVAKVMLTTYKTHPWTVMRASELVKWTDGNGYNDILNRKTKNMHGIVSRLPSMISSGSTLNKIKNIALKEKDLIDKINLLVKDKDTDFHIIPDIPHKKLLNALKAYAPNIKPEEVMLLYDGTVFGGSREGFLLTKDCIYGKSCSDEQPVSIFLSEIKEYHYTKKKGFFDLGKMMINNTFTIDILTDEAGDAMGSVIKLLIDSK